MSNLRMRQNKVYYMENVKYDQWNEIKKFINKNSNNVFFKERDIFYLKMWKNVWYEQNWKWEHFVRPVIILKKFNNYLFWAIPLTTQVKNWKYYHNFEFNWITQTAILSQIKLFDSKRLMEKKWMLWKIEFLQIKEKVKGLL